MTPKSTKASTIPVPEWSEGFFAMEPALCDLALMAKIAHQKIYDAVGETTFDKGDNVIAHNLTNETVCLAMFAISQLMRMIDDLNTDYQNRFVGRVGATS